MDNPNVAGLEACQRLAKVCSLLTIVRTYYWWAERPQEQPYLVHEFVDTLRPGPVYTRAPSIGEMLAYIRQRKWSYIIRHGVDSELCEVEVRRSDEDGNFPASKANSATHEEPAEAVTLALAEALEKEAGSDQ